jgi:hypothetical protein
MEATWTAPVAGVFGASTLSLRGQRADLGPVPLTWRTAGLSELRDKSHWRGGLPIDCP